MCGVIGIIGPEVVEGQKRSEQDVESCDAAYQAYRGLLALQHRGQDAAGILAYSATTRMFSNEKDLGLVASVFDEAKIQKLSGYMAVGHTRYATTGTDGTRDIQPIVTGAPFGLGMAHNGNTLNYYSLAQKLADEHGRQLLTTNDLEVIMHYLGLYLLNGAAAPTEETFQFSNIKRAAAELFKTVVGGYAAVGLIAGQGLIALRDSKGLRPLAIGERKLDNGDTFYCIASETSAITRLGYTYLRDVAPGEVVFINNKGEMQSAVVGADGDPAPCMFEWVYFSGAEGAIENKSVYSVRLKLGERLAVKVQKAIDDGDIAPDVIMPVPDTSRTAAIAVGGVLGVPYREGLIKNRYIGRSFILNSQEKREAAVEQKLIPILSEIEGKSIFLIDDSVVRGTTSRKIVQMLRKYGAKDISLGITCPPLRYACYYGIDFPDPSALIADNKTIEEIEKSLGVEKVIYLDEDDMREAIGLSKLCMACLNNKYPTAIEEAKSFSEARGNVQKMGRV